MKKLSTFLKASIATGSLLATNAFAAVLPMTPADLATSEGTIQSDIAAGGAVAITVALAVLAVKAFKRSVG